MGSFSCGTHIHALGFECFNSQVFAGSDDDASNPLEHFTTWVLHNGQD
jgi:hypothetical protein